MGYDLYITRKRNWFDDNGPAISRDEWLAIVESDPELSLRPNDEFLTANWNGDCKYPDPWFSYCATATAIETKNPDEPIIAKMLELAARLGARVQGDEGEVYVTPTEWHHEDENNANTKQTQGASRTWWQRIFGAH